MRLFIAHSGLPRSHWPETSLWQHSKAGGLLSSQAPGVSQGQSSHSDCSHPLAVLIPRCSRRPHNERSVWRPTTAVLPQRTTDMTFTKCSASHSPTNIQYPNKLHSVERNGKIEDRRVGSPKGREERRPQHRELLKGIEWKFCPPHVIPNPCAVILSIVQKMRLFKQYSSATCPFIQFTVTTIVKLKNAQ